MPKVGGRPAPAPSMGSQRTDPRPRLLLAVDAGDVAHLPDAAYARQVAPATREALRLVEQWRPRVVVVGFDAETIDPAAVCAAALQAGTVAVLAIMAVPEQAPHAIRAGAHAILLKPFSLNLASARIGRLTRETLWAFGGASAPQAGINVACPDLSCPTCGRAGAIWFEHASRRRAWYACLGCEQVWVGGGKGLTN